MHSLANKRRNDEGFTLVELIVGASVTTILSIAIVATIVTWLHQYTVSTLRNHLTTDAQIAVQKIGDDIRRSNRLLVENQTPDPNAITPPGKWLTRDSLIVLAQTPRDKDGKGLFDPPAGSYVGIPDSIVYYIKDGALYRRIVPANYTGNVNLPLKTCPSTGGCPADVKIVDRVKSISYTFYDKAGNITFEPAKTTSIKVGLELTATQVGQEVTAKRNSTVTFRMAGSGAIYTSAPFAVGAGGIELVNGAQIRSDDSKRDIYIRGGINFNITDTIGIASRPLRNVYVGNQSCGVNYSQICPSEPITLSHGSIYADSVCATGQSTASSSFGVIQMLNSGCTAPLLNLPLFNKAAHIAKMINSAGSVTCNAAPSSCSASLPANTRYNGSIGGGNAVLNLTVNGDLYVTGNFGNIPTGGSSLATTITVAEGVTTRPIIVVNGRIGLEWTTINKNSSGISPIFISFHSSDLSCSQGDSCERTAALIYNSLQQNGDAIELNGPGTMNGSFYAYYDSIRLADQVVVNGTMAGQRIKFDNGLTRINLTNDFWPS